MEKQTTKEKDSAIVLGQPRTRFSDCCNQEIIKNRCPNCGRWFEQEEGRRELKIKGLDGKTNTKGRHYIVTTIQTEPAKEDKTPKYIKALQDRGLRVDSWTASDL
jgi:hypothetical protein